MKASTAFSAHTAMSQNLTRQQLQAWLHDWAVSIARTARKQLNLLQQRAYSLGFVTLRSASEQPHQPMDMWKQPISAAPLTKLQELLDWQPADYPFYPGPDLRQGTAVFTEEQRRACKAIGPRLLACHDLHGNYHSDALPQGNEDADYYRLTQWSSIDVFVYFSHALVTIPPPGWINAAHTNGVPVLGTFITEWEAGSIICELLLWTEQSAEAVALQLAKIAAFFGFDGWLLNIENPVLRRLIPNLIHFIRVLRRVMHEMVPGSQVIWYDAVTTDGILEWQDTLNELNLPFFEAADAIFINYTWKQETPQQAAAVAGARRHDVYMGVDVFGRNTFGGGGMTCDVALAAARSAGLSAALFAPAWVWEVGNRADWLQRQQAFWDKIQACWELPRALVCHLPFSTCFDQGAGQARCADGDLVLQQPWYNLSCQSALPTLRQPATSYDPASNTFCGGAAATKQGVLQAALCSDLAFQLGSCLKFEGRVESGTSSSVEIFTADLLIPEPGLRVAFTFRPLLPASQASMELWCWMEPSNSIATHAAASGDIATRQDVATSQGGATKQGGARPSAADEQDAAQKGSASSDCSADGSGPWILARLQGNALLLISKDGPQAVHIAEGVQETAHHSNGWQTLYYRLPSHLPDFSHLTLRSIEVTAVAPAVPSASPAALTPLEPCLGYVGSIALTAWDEIIPQPKVSGVAFSQTIWTAPFDAAAKPHSSKPYGLSAQEQGSTEDSATTEETDDVVRAGVTMSHPSSVPCTIWLYTTLRFSVINLEPASRFEVFHRVLAGDTVDSSSPAVRSKESEAADGAEWVWLGTTVVCLFRVNQLQVPTNAVSVQFAVQAADALGRLVPFDNAAISTVSRP